MFINLISPSSLFFFSPFDQFVLVLTFLIFFFYLYNYFKLDSTPDEAISDIKTRLSNLLRQRRNNAERVVKLGEKLIEIRKDQKTLLKFSFQSLLPFYTFSQRNIILNNVTNSSLFFSGLLQKYKKEHLHKLFSILSYPSPSRKALYRFYFKMTFHPKSLLSDLTLNDRSIYYRYLLNRVMLRRIKCTFFPLISLISKRFRFVKQPFSSNAFQRQLYSFEYKVRRKPPKSSNLKINEEMVLSQIKTKMKQLLVKVPINNIINKLCTEFPKKKS